MLDVAELFEPPSVRNPYPTLAHMVAAVRSGKKAMIAELFDETSIEEGDQPYAEFARAALDAGLLLIHRRYPDLPEVHVFALLPSETWRVEAYAMLHSLDLVWCEQLELFESQLLGYDNEQRAEWLDSIRKSRLGYAGPTVYFLVAERDSSSMAQLGMKCFPLDSAQESLQAYCPRGRACVVRPNALQLIPPGRRLCRAAIARDSWSQWFSPRAPGSRIFVAQMTDVTALNRALVSPIQAFTAFGWADEFAEDPDRG